MPKGYSVRLRYLEVAEAIARRQFPIRYSARLIAAATRNGLRGAP